MGTNNGEWREGRRKKEKKKTQRKKKWVRGRGTTGSRCGEGERLLKDIGSPVQHVVIQRPCVGESDVLRPFLQDGFSESDL
jgi:hypothetical protein